MTSQARIDANRINAGKSTGPRTAEGKARARLNALRHGLRADEVVLPTESAAEFRAHLDAWTADWRPPTETRSFLVERAAVASWRLRRCVRVESERLSRRATTALAEWDRQTDQEVAREVGRLTRDPVEALEALEATRAGSDRLIELWAEILEAAEDPEGWCSPDDHHVRFINLWGTRPDDDEDEARQMIDASWGLLLRNRPDLAEPDGLGPMGDAEAADFRAEIADAARSRTQELVEARDGLPDESADRGRYAEMVALESHPEDATLHRYEARHDREARATIGLLAQLSRTGADLPAPEDEPEEVGEPVEADAPDGPVAQAPEPRPRRAEGGGEGRAPNEPNGDGPRSAVPQAGRDRDGRSWPVEGGAEAPPVPLKGRSDR